MIDHIRDLGIRWWIAEAAIPSWPGAGDTGADYVRLVASVRAREAAWKALCDAVDAQQERERIRAEAER